MNFWEVACSQEEFDNGVLSIYHQNIQEDYKVFYMRSKYYDCKYYNKEGRVSILIDYSPLAIFKYNLAEYTYPVANKLYSRDNYSIVNMGQKDINANHLGVYRMLLEKLHFTIEQMNDFEKYVLDNL